MTIAIYTHLFNETVSSSTSRVNDKTVCVLGNGMDAERNSCGPIWGTIPARA